MSFSILLPFLFATAVLAAVGIVMLYDPFRVGANAAQLALSAFLASMLSWSLWITGNVIVISFFNSSYTAWEVNVMVAMVIGPPVARWFAGKHILSDDSNLAVNVGIALAGAIIGAIVGRFVLAELLAVEYSGTGLPGTANVMWAWLGAVCGGHVHAFVIAVQSVVARRDP
jgi:hypothetical protein